jgi:hypothetical protein
MRVLAKIILIPAFLIGLLSGFGLLVSFLNGSEQLRIESFTVLIVCGMASLIIAIFLDSKESSAPLDTRLQNFKSQEEKITKIEPTEIDYPLEISIAGVTHANRDGSSRQLILEKTEVLTELKIIPEPQNEYDSNAIQVVSQYGCLGYIPKDLAKNLIRQDIAKLKAILIKKGILESGVYWGKILITPRADGAYAQQDLSNPATQSPIDAEHSKTAYNKYTEFELPLGYLEQSAMPGNNLNGHLRVSREYLPPAYCSIKRSFNDKPHYDKPIKNKELIEVIASYLKGELERLTDLKKYPIQNMENAKLMAWQEEIKLYSDALNLFNSKVSIKEISTSSLCYELNFFNLIDLIDEIEGINEFKVNEQITGYAINGLFHGEVEIISNNTNSYFKGIYINGFKNGYGVEVSPSGDIYEGDYVDGYRCGLGRLKLADRTLTGIFVNGKHYDQSLFRDFQPPYFWIGYNDELETLIFVPRDGLNKPGCRSIFVTKPVTWEVFEVEATKLGTPIRKHLESLPPSEQELLLDQIECWKDDFKKNGFKAIYSKILPYYVEEDFSLEEYTGLIENYSPELRMAEKFVLAGQDEQLKTITDLIRHEDAEYDY